MTKTQKVVALLAQLGVQRTEITAQHLAAVEAFTADLYSDAEAYRLLERIAEKAAEPFKTEHKTKTVGEWRGEMGDLINEALWFVVARRRETVERLENGAMAGGANRE